MSANKIVMKIVSISFSVLVVVLIIFALVKVGTSAYDFGYRIFTEEPMSATPGKDVVVQVEDGMSSSDIASLLQDKNLIRDSKVFLVQLKLSAYANKIKPGIYTLNTSMTAKELMQAMATTEEDTENVTEESTENSSEVPTEDKQTAE